MFVCFVCGYCVVLYGRCVIYGVSERFACVRVSVCDVLRDDVWIACLCCLCLNVCMCYVFCVYCLRVIL